MQPSVAQVALGSYTLAMPGPHVLTDVVEVYVFRLAETATGRSLSSSVEFLQLHRTEGQMARTWQPVMGHIEGDETAAAAALRELHEETAYAPGHGLSDLWQLETVNTYFTAAKNHVMMSPCFAACVVPGQQPQLDDDHDNYRWVRREQAERLFAWPGQRVAVEQVIRDILPALSGNTRHDEQPIADLLRIDLDSA